MEIEKEEGREGEGDRTWEVWRGVGPTWHSQFPSRAHHGKPARGTPHPPPTPFIIIIIIQPRQWVPPTWPFIPSLHTLSSSGPDL